MRLFIAIPVPDSIKQHARMIRNNLGKARPDVKWVEYQNYHLTLKFLGNVQEKMLPQIRKALILAAQSIPAFALSTGKIGFFPDQIRPRVVWLGIGGETITAYELGRKIDAALLPLGFTEDEKRQIHLTLGRVRSDLRLDDLRKIAAGMDNKKKGIPFQVQEFHLIKSCLTPNGPNYMLLDAFGVNG